MADVKWIKLVVGMFDGKSFKKIKRAKIGGESYRDKLTAIWFELMDFAGKCNHAGAFVDSHEIPFANIEDIAIMIDREVDELQLCMSFFINEGMIEIVEDVYMLSNWSQYQNEIGLEEIREKNRQRQARFREKKRLLIEEIPKAAEDDVTVTLRNAVDKDTERDLEKENIYKYIVEYLNQKTGASYKSTTKKTKACIHARLQEGFTVDDFKTVIDKKYEEWKGTEFEQYLRPETLFGTKFESYLNAKTKDKKGTVNEYENIARNAGLWI